MTRILAIETSTTVCSVAVAEGNKILAYRELFEANSHAKVLTVFIEELFSQLDFPLKDIDAVAVSSGPGSYTGLRIGVSTAKGICFAINKPLIAISSLLALTATIPSQDTFTNTNNIWFCPMIDARRMEVYTAFYDKQLQLQKEVSADIIDEESYLDILNERKVVFFGNGSDKCKSTISHDNALFLDNIVPHASKMIGPALRAFENKKFEDVAYFEPFYLKDFVAIKSKKKIL